LPEADPDAEPPGDGGGFRAEETGTHSDQVPPPA
jgi:hypothetical protein